MQTFFCDEDYEAYLALLAEWTSKAKVSVWAYCLMPNHVHLILVPSSPDGLRRAVAETHRRYTRRVNSREGWRGHLWQERFASFVMDESHLLPAARHVERNPVKAKLVTLAEKWCWSSAAAHVAVRDDGLCQGQWLTDRIAGWVCTWRDYLAEPDDPGIVEAIRLHGNTGRPLGSDSFVRKFEKRLGRRLLPRKPGRPKKKDRKQYTVPR